MTRVSKQEQTEQRDNVNRGILGPRGRNRFPFNREFECIGVDFAWEAESPPSSVPIAAEHPTSNAQLPIWWANFWDDRPKMVGGSCGLAIFRFSQFFIFVP